MEFLDELSVLSVDPVLITFTFVGIHQSVVENVIFRFVPSHKLCVEVSGLLKKYI